MSDIEIPSIFCDCCKKKIEKQKKVKKIHKCIICDEVCCLGSKKWCLTHKKEHIKKKRKEYNKKQYSKKKAESIDS